MAIKYKDFEKREQLRKDYIDKAAEAAKTQANAYTDEQIRNIPAPPAPDIPTALPQKYEAFKVQLVQGKVSQSRSQTWEEYHKPLWNGSEVLTNSSATTKAHFVTDTVLYWRSPRKYNLLITINGTEKEFVFEGEHSQYGTNWVIWQLKENNVVVAEAECIGAGNGQYYNNTSTVYVYCPDGSPYIGQTMTSARYGKKQYVYTLMYPEAVLQQPSETENTRFLTMCQSIATKNAKLKLTLTDNVIEANYANISNELVTTDYVDVDSRIRWIGIVADRVPNKANGTDIHDDMKTCIKGVLEVEYTDEEATKECVYDKIQGESYTFKIGDFNHDESSAFDYYFNGSILIPFSNAQIQASFTYRPVSGTENSIQVKSMVNNGQMLPYFDISELFGQAANTVMAIITSNTAVENVDMGGRPVTTIALTSNVQNFTDANDEIMVGSILTLTPSSLPQTYKKKAVTLATSGWVARALDLSTIWTTKFVSGAHKFCVFDKTYNVKQGDSIVYTYNGYQYTATADYKPQKNYLYIQLPYNGNTIQYLNFNAAPTENNDIAASNTSSCVMIANSSSPISISIVSIGGIAVADAEYNYDYTDADVKVNSEVRFTLDEANGKIAGQFGLKKTIDKEAGKLTFTAGTLPTSAITGTLEIGETSTEGAAFVEGIIEPSSVPATVAKTDVENTFTKTQTFNGTESQAGVKTNAIDNESGNRIVYFNGTKQMFGSGAIPTQVRTSEQRLKLERPVSGGTGTEIVEIANVSDIGTGGVVIKRKKFTAKVSDGTLLLDNKANVVLTESKNWSTVERVRQTNENFVSPIALGLDLQIGGVYTFTVGEATYTATCGFFTASYVATGETALVTFGTGGQAKMLEFTIGERKLRIVDCAVPYGYDEITSPDVAYDGGQVKEAVAAMAFWDDLSSTAISGELTLKTSTYGDVRITDADITSESFVWFETEGTYAFATSGSATFYYAVDVANSQIKTVTYDIITGMGAGAACEQQTLPKVVNVCIAPSGWTENKIDSPTQGSVPSTSYYSKPNLVYKDTAGAVAASNAGIEVYQTQACPTKFGIKRTSENSTIWAAVKLD